MRRRDILLGIAVWALAGGCAKRHHVNRNPLIGDNETEQIVTIILDFSGSFEGTMAERGWDFAMKAIGKYFRDRIGTEDRLIIGQISGAKYSLLWEGKPLELKRSFASAEEFKQFVQGKADPNASLVNDSIAHAIHYMLNNPRVAGGNVRMALLVLSDMQDTAGDAEQSQARLTQALATFGEQRGIVGLYYVDQFQVAVWQNTLYQAGIRNAIVESDIVRQPKLPSFDE